MFLNDAYRTFSLKEQSLASMRIDIISLFPEFVAQCASFGVVGRARSRGILDLNSWNPRDYSDRKDRRIDERPYGGGPGMVMRIEPLRACLDAIVATSAEATPHVVSVSPQGRRLDQAKVRSLSAHSHLVLLCGRYEGVDERFLSHRVDEEISIGDYVLSGGELGAAVVIDAVTRCLHGVLGDETSAQQDSFEGHLGLLDCPHFTHPAHHEWGDVPLVLRSGNHAHIAQWRRQQALGRTWLRRPDILAAADLSAEDRVLLERFIQTSAG